jgi:hypothetical protein
MAGDIFTKKTGRFRTIAILVRDALSFCARATQLVINAGVSKVSHTGIACTWLNLRTRNRARVGRTSKAGSTSAHFLIFERISCVVTDEGFATRAGCITTMIGCIPLLEQEDRGTQMDMMAQ